MPVIPVTLPATLEPHRALFEGLLRPEERPGPSKVTPLRQAIAASVRPGQALHTLITHAIPYALVSEVVRQYSGRAPGFCLLTLGAVQHAVLLLRSGLLARLVTTYCGDIYPAPGPNPAFSEAVLGGRLTLQHWSVLTYSLRLLAGALGLPGLPTRSLLGSSMAQDNREDFAEFDSPLSGERVGWVRALRPDLTLVHGWVADPSGNVLFSPPLAENLWGALAAREGVVASVEKVVDLDFIRAHAHLPCLPASRVRAVVELPFGAHPGGFFGRPLAGCRTYAEDYDFIVEFRRANRQPDSFERWVRHWVLEPVDQVEYLSRLGAGRLADLIERGRPGAIWDELAAGSGALGLADPVLPVEIATAEAARRLAARCRAGGYRTILAGQGLSNLAAWLAALVCKQTEGLDVELVAETGFYGYLPQLGNPFLFNFANIPRCKALTDALWSLGAMVGGPGAHCLGSLSAAQVDSQGNLNSTLIPGALVLVGSGGACDVLSGCERAVVTLPLEPGRMVERVPYVTAPGERVDCVVTDRAVFERPADGGPLTVVALARREAGAEQAQLEALRARLDFRPPIAERLEWIASPTEAERIALRLFDPRRAFLRQRD